MATERSSTWARSAGAGRNSSGRTKSKKRVTSELVRSTSEEMKPAISRDTSFSEETLWLSISAAARMGPGGLPRSGPRAPPTPAERAQPVGPPHSFFGLLQVAIGFGKLVGHGFGLRELLAQRFGQGVSQIAGHRQKDHAQRQLAFLLQLDEPLFPIDESQERKIRARRQHDEDQRAWQPERRAGRDHRQKQKPVKAAAQRAREADQGIAEEQLQDDPNHLAARGAYEFELGLQNLQSAQRRERTDLIDVAVRAEHRHAREKQEPHDILQVNPLGAAPPPCKLSHDAIPDRIMPQ